ncbi:HET-domain-containing protein [Aaosphaeria arxii CBS 175.79]|uniref:HET-domain-containing protein n=1 Tax=Aaosphaeria arxii CBS 175.79 TaxID=1450172 RepID=A0A6A5Y356_9PLEO|nr:HET-domain-containing protein [Aaosphaeria arxii CBS 175.79]KAF2019699.1 HET-domain-containing protein [Aaosphaeria arxii CBS 175.79]
MCLICDDISKAISNYRQKLDKVNEEVVWERSPLKNSEICATIDRLLHLFQTPRECFEDTHHITLTSIGVNSFNGTYMCSGHGLQYGPHFNGAILHELSSDWDLCNGDISIDPHWIDLDRIRGWITDCNNNHGGICHSIKDEWRTLSSPPTEILLINVVRKCLESRRLPCSYVALSYVWGKHADALKTLLSNVSTLSVEDALDAPSIRARLPQTIRDSMLLTGLLGLEYIWIDRFCIVQDDEEMKAEQLDAMAAIYSHAYLTIIAQDGDDSYGLRGIDRKGQSRSANLTPLQFSSSCRVVPDTLENVWSLHETRGWTFQEEHLSRRGLHFKDDMVKWRCNQTTRRESCPKPLNTCPWVVLPAQDDLYFAWPYIDKYADLVDMYSYRYLTLPTDAYNAFSAIVQTVSRAMEGGCLFGIPEMFFDGCLLWYPRIGEGRRKDADGRVLNAFPSWSWLSWDGPVNTTMWIHTHPYIDTGKRRGVCNLDVVVSPTVSWKKRNLSTGLLENISNTYYRFSQLSWEGAGMTPDSGVLPPGYRFRQPVPIPCHPLVQPTRRYSPILEFRSQRLYLRRGYKVENRFIRTPYLYSLMATSDGPISGGISYDADPENTSEECELICIGKAEVDGSKVEFFFNRIFAEYDHLGRESGRHWKPDDSVRADNGKYRFYNVLLIEWKDGIAYRKGLGRVEQSFWDGAETEEIDVRLG